MRIGDEVLIKGTINEIRKDIVIIENEGGYFGTVPSEIIEKKTEWIDVKDDYNKGYEDGYKDGSDDGYKEGKKVYAAAYYQGYSAGYNHEYDDTTESEYERGLKDAWEAARKLFKYYPLAELPDFFSIFSASEAVAKIKKHEYEKDKIEQLIKDEDEIRVGDEVRSLLNNCKGIIIEAHKTKDNDTSVQIFWLDKNCCSTAYYNDHTYVKTGRNLPCLLEVINMMKGSVTDADSN